MLDKEILLWIAYIICVLICVYKMHQWSSDQSLDGVIGVTPGFDAIIALLFAPVFVVVYITVKIIKFISLRTKK